MPTLKLFGSAVLALGITYATLQVLTANAASGDALYIKSSGDTILTTPQRTAALVCFAQSFPEQPVTRITRMYGRRDGEKLVGSACAQKVLTSRERLAQEIQGKMEGTDVVCLEDRDMTPAQTKCWTDLLKSIAPTIAFDQTIDCSMRLDGSNVVVVLNYLATATPDGYFAAKAAGSVVRLVEQVP
jgi:hypothetical protein